jgi:Family of unknown function (DUF6186)
MNSHNITVAGYAAAVIGGVLLQVLATKTGAPIPRLGNVISRVMRTRAGRVGVLVAWAWLGLHFFAKLGGGPLSICQSHVARPCLPPG